jgi:hypothetical protein
MLKIKKWGTIFKTLSDLESYYTFTLFFPSKQLQNEKGKAKIEYIH